MSAFTDWLADTSQRRVLLADITAYDESNSPHIETIRLGSETYLTGAADTPANAMYRQRIVGNPFFERAMSNAFTGRSFLSVGELELNNIDGGLDDWLDKNFDGRQIVLKLGAPEWSISQFGTILTGQVQRIRVESDEIIKLIIKDQAESLNGPIQENLISTGEAEDRPIPLCYGYAYNITPVKIPLGTSPETYKYQVHDGPVEDVCVQLYDQGAPSAIGVTKDNANGTFTLGSTPNGEITCDVKGAKPSASPTVWLQTPGQILSEIATNLGATVDAASLAQLDTDAPYQLGIYIDENRENAVDVIDRILPGGWWWGAGRDGNIKAALLSPISSPSGPVMTIDELETQGDLALEIIDDVNWRLTVGYKRNYTPNQSPQGTVTDSRREFLKLEYRTAAASDSTVKTANLDARDPELLESYITSSSDASTEAARLLTLSKTHRYLYTVDCFVGPYQLEIGDVVTLKDTRFGLAGGVDCVVVGLTEYFLDNRVTVTLWR